MAKPDYDKIHEMEEELGLDETPAPVSTPSPHRLIAYVAKMDDGTTLEWAEKVTFDISPEGPGHMLESRKAGMYGLTVNGSWYPTHRVHSVTWTISDGREPSAENH